jgi:hypothetical protein
MCQVAHPDFGLSTFRIVHVPCMADRLSLSEVLNKNDVTI